MDAPPSDYSLWHWSSADAPERARLYAWRDLVSRKLLKVDVQPLSDAPYRAHVQLRALPGLRFAWGAIDASSNRRNREFAASENDDFILLINQDGEFEVTQNGREVTLGAGDACLVACSDPGIFVRPSFGRLVCVRIPRENLSSRVLRLHDMTARLVPHETAALRLLMSYVRVLGDNRALATAELRSLIVSHIHDLTVLVLNPSRENFAISESGGLRAARLRNVKSFILKNLARNELSINAVAVRFGISPRYIQKLLEIDGTTYSEFVQNSRLARVHDELADPAARQRSIREIALDTGFGDISHFNHAFRRRYEASPSEVRSMASRSERTAPVLRARRAP
jgi:AraC-like DNA-binding protein